MKLVNRFDRYITLTFVMSIIVVMAASYFTFNQVIRNHVDQQHQATIPLFALVNNDIIRPLTISHSMANDYLLQTFIQQEQIDKNELLKYLTQIANNYNVLSFVALEEHNFMLESDQKITPLTSESAEWYHRIKKKNKDQFADIGNADDPHLYFDIKIKTPENKFLGFAGVAIDLDHFAKEFKAYQDKFGFELYLVDEDNNIMLTSTQFMKTESHHRKDETISVGSLPWYETFMQYRDNNKISQRVNTSTTEFIVSQLAIPELSWHLYLVSPPSFKQSAYWRSFTSKLLIFFLIACLLYLVFNTTLGYFKRSVIASSEIDFLTQLPNRSYINWRYKELKNEYQHTAIVICDIDNFKTTNDKYGHLVGDDVLKVIAERLTENIRKIDIVGRWGGEEFILIFPETTSEEARELTERIRKNIEESTFDFASCSEPLQTTVSFGISVGNVHHESLNTIIERADKALYQAKASGRNQVKVIET